MELPSHDDDRNPPDHESRITKLEVRVQDLSVELKLLRQAVELGFKMQNERIDALPGQILAVVRAELSERLAAQNDLHNLRNEEFRKSIEARLEVWRAENDRKLETWRKENDSKLERWRKENDSKLETLSAKMDSKLETWRKDGDSKLEMWRKDGDAKLEMWRRDDDAKLETWRNENDGKFEEWRREMRIWFRLIVGILITAMVASFFN